MHGTKGGLTSADGAIHLRYLDPKAKLKPRPPRHDTLPQDDYGKNDRLKWMEKTIPVKPKSACDTATFWDELYRAVRLGSPFPITPDDVVEVMRIVSEAIKRNQERRQTRRR